jgi:two-component system CheB/CheR fusion protein
VKHGALSVEGGRIEVSWEIHSHGSDRRVRLRWRELGAAIRDVPDRRGYGSEILERSIPHMLEGSFERTFHPDGIECLISFAIPT